MAADFSDLSTPALYLALDPKYVLLAPSGTQTVVLGQATETDTATAFGITLGINEAVETDTATTFTITNGQVVAFGQATETDTATMFGITTRAQFARVGSVMIAN